jgi:RES domain-containing protein
MLAPRWAHEPLSGVGAARHGGRWNPKGVPALYMSEHYAIAIAEYEQELGIRPGTLCAYEVKTRAIADLTKPGVLKSLGAKPGDLTGPWKQIALVERRRPPSWALAERLIAEGVRGVRVPSAQARGVNLVLWRWDDKECQVLDPLGDLPKDQRSWSSKGSGKWRGVTRRTTVDQRRPLLPSAGEGAARLSERRMGAVSSQSRENVTAQQCVRGACRSLPEYGRARCCRHR